MICLGSGVYGLWIVYYVLTMPWTSSVRAIFAVLFVVPSVMLLGILSGWLNGWIQDRQWLGKPVSIQLRWGIYMWFVNAWMLVAIAVLVGDTTRPIHAVPYVMISLFCVGKTLRLAFYDR